MHRFNDGKRLQIDLMPATRQLVADNRGNFQLFVWKRFEQNQNHGDTANTERECTLSTAADDDSQNYRKQIERVVRRSLSKFAADIIILRFAHTHTICMHQSTNGMHHIASAAAAAGHRWIPKWKLSNAAKWKSHELVNDKSIWLIKYIFLSQHFHESDSRRKRRVRLRIPSSKEMHSILWAGGNCLLHVRFSGAVQRPTELLQNGNEAKQY